MFLVCFDFASYLILLSLLLEFSSLCPFRPQELFRYRNVGQRLGGPSNPFCWLALTKPGCPPNHVTHIKLKLLKVYKPLPSDNLELIQILSKRLRYR